MRRDEEKGEANIENCKKSQQRFFASLVNEIPFSTTW